MNAGINVFVQIRDVVCACVCVYCVCIVCAFAWNRLAVYVETVCALVATFIAVSDRHIQTSTNACLALRLTPVELLV